MNQIIEPRVAKQLGFAAVLGVPILCGLVNQIRMLISGELRAIPVFIDPPGEIAPIISLNAQWWILLTVFALVGFVLTASGSFSRIPRRIAIPFYIYLLFLLILVWPV